MAEVAVLGTGRMGAAIARRLAAAGHAVTVWNRTEASAVRLAASLPEARIRVATDAADAVAERDVVVSMLADGNATRAVLLHKDVLVRLPPGAVVCDMATSGVDVARELARAMAERGVLFLDAPVSGSVPAVEAGTLLVMAAGDAAALAAAGEVLGAVADRIVLVGEPGAGQAMKLAVNLVVHDLNAALAESLVLAERAGIARDKAYDVLEQSVVGAPFVRYKRQAFLDSDAPVAMSLALVAKDLRLITEFAESAAAPVAVTSAAREAVDEACAAGLGSSDMAELSRFLRPA
jgi:3-hydroxyisobutyrate dehydrogenase